ncbi:MAG: sulfotransferase [Thermoguttaceae bacterium]|nr:sulfotransferase [Thermoguttaceae bacterium]MDW8039460.1 sulfotransferase [Thermoguttaceae bacterium]
MISQKPDVFIIGVHRRCGTNFLADALKLLPHFQEPRPLAEDYLLEHAPLLVEYARRTAAKRYQKRFQEAGEFEACQRLLLRRLGDGLRSFLRDYIRPDCRLLTHTPDPDYLELFFDLFPDAQLVLLVRDGRDVVESAARSWPSEPYSYWMYAWALGARRILQFIHGPGQDYQQKWHLVRYEDLLTDRTAMKKLLQFLGEDPDQYPWPEFDNMPVRGSSTHRGGHQELHWQPVEKTKDFNPIGRWQSWSRWRRWQFRRIAGRELIELGYTW